MKLADGSGGLETYRGHTTYERDEQDDDAQPVGDHKELECFASDLEEEMRLISGEVRSRKTGLVDAPLGSTTRRSR